jgi:hypothetical protein
VAPNTYLTLLLSLFICLMSSQTWY